MYKYISMFTISSFLMSTYILFAKYRANKNKKSIILLFSISLIILFKSIVIYKNIYFSSIDYIYNILIILSILGLVKSKIQKEKSIILSIYSLYIFFSLIFNNNEDMINIGKFIDLLLSMYILYVLFKDNIIFINEKEESIKSRLNKIDNKIKIDNKKLVENKNITKSISDTLSKKQDILEMILGSSNKCLMIIDNHGNVLSDDNNFYKMWNQYKNYDSKIKLNMFLEDNIKNSDDFLYSIINVREFNKQIVNEIESKDERYFNCTYSPFTINNETVGVVCSLVDITYEKKSKKKIKENDTKYKKIVDNIPYSILIVDDNDILYSNEKNKEIDFYNDDIKNIILEKSIKGEVYYKSKSSNNLCLNIDRVDFYDGENIKNVVAIRNITKYKELIRKVDLSKKKYESFVNLIPEGIYMYDLNNKNIVYSNKSLNDMINLVNVSSNNFINTNQTFTITDDKLNGEIKYKRNKLKNKYGKDVYIESGSMVIDVNQKLKGIGIVNDVTDIVKSEIIEREIEEKKRENKMKMEFFINMSHELKTPLNVITSSNQLLEIVYKDYISNNPESEISKVTGIVKKHSYMLMGLINNIIELSKLESDFYESERDYYNLISVIEDICEEFNSYVKVNNVNILFDTDKEEKVANIDPKDIEKIILTILSMIIRYTGKDSIINVDLNILDEKTIISIKNNGNYDYQRYLKDNEKKSLELGLAVVKLLLNLYDGKLNIETNEINSIEINIEIKSEAKSKKYKERIKHKGDNYIYAEYLRMCNF